MFKEVKSLLNLNWIYILFIITIFWIGEVNLFSAANGSLDPWAKKQLVRFSIFLPIFFLVAMIKPRLVFDLSEIFLFLIILGLIATLFFGYIGGGSRRWIRIGFFNLQISEFAKIFLVLYLSKYFHNLDLNGHLGISRSLVPILLIFFIFLLIAAQPDLGTALIILILGCSMIFFIGIKIIYPALLSIFLILSSPLIWNLLKPYQQNRVLTFLNPDLDPLGKGYHIIQSKIAIGSGGMRGNGFLGGSQSSLNFIPEKETDFVFSIFAEQFGFVGSLFLLSLFFIIIIVPIVKSFKIRNTYIKLVILGLSFKILIEVFINISMTLGVLPVVGVALPLMSYGGSSLLSNMVILGLIINFMSADKKVKYFR
jgi:rod shape determining protein RodA|tara:strand:+ start:144 stop:1247 length:1104 start_codon:yes stop_codon:yes gene_type:complete